MAPPEAPPLSPGPAPASRLTPAAQALLAERLKRRSAAPASQQVIPRSAEPGAAPPSFAQERLWFLAKLTPGSAAYNIARAFVLRGPLDGAALERSLREVVHRHTALRTSFAAVGPVLVQQVDPVPVLLLPTVELAGLPAGLAGVREAEVKRLRHEEARRPFDLESGPPLRLLLLHLGEDEHMLLLTVHHIAADGWSLDILFRELSELYRLFSWGHPALLPDLPVQYADFAAWQRARLQGELLERLLSWWRRQLAGAPPVLELPSDRPRPPVRTWAGGWRAFSLAVTGPVLRQTAAARAASPFMVLLAAFFALLQRTAGRTDLVVGSPVAGRDRSELEPLIGLFVNTLVLRADLAGDPRFDEVLLRTREATLGAYDHQEMPFDKLVEVLAPERGLAQTPLFQVLFVLENTGRTQLALTGLAVDPLPAWGGAAKFDLAFTFLESGEGFTISLVYDREIFDAATMARLAAHYETLLAGAVADPGRRLSELPLLAPGELQQLLYEWNGGNGARSEATEGTIQDLFAAQARSQPRATAVVCEVESLTYADLSMQANRLAHHLRGLGVGPEVAVGVCLDRSMEAVVAFLGVLKAGGAYVPLDPAYPRERLAFMLEDTAAPVVVTLSRHLDALPDLNGRGVVVLDRDQERLAARSTADPQSAAGPGNLAYVIFTSGSTGRPKGVLVTHGNVVRLFAATRQWFDFGPGDVWTLFHSLAFDFSVWEMWGALLHGGRLVVVPYLMSRSPEDFLRLLDTEGVTVLNQTPSAFRQLVQACRESGVSYRLALRWVVFGGEALDPQSLVPWLDRHPDRPRLVNMYGITETTVHVTFRPLSQEDAASPHSPIGRAIPDLALHLREPGGALVPAGVPGELCVGGAGLARGYLGRPDLTAQRFVPDPFAAADGGGPGARLYRSGDLARRRHDGELEYLGRIDQQVKIRGFRIELGEVEAALCAQPGVREAVVVAREDAPGEQRLIAYVVPEASGLPAELRSCLRERLPDYMLPAVFVTMASLPLNANGKVDRKALPEPGAEREPGERRVAPRSPVEELLAGIWAEVLRIAPPGVDESFFELGGHSLLATRVISRVREVCGVELPLRVLFEGPTVAELAARVETARRNGKLPLTAPILPARLPAGALAPLSFSQERLWFLARLEPGSPFYNVPAALRLRGRLDVPALARSLAAIRRRHSVLRTVFTVSASGPVQRIVEGPPASLPIADLVGLAPGARQAEARRLAAEEARWPFDLETGPPLRTTLVALSRTEHLLLLTLHHIVSDGWSLEIFTRELSAFYGGAHPQPAEPPIQYTDFARWQREHVRGEVLEGQLATWRRRLAGAPALLELPADRPRPPVMRFRGGRVPVTLDRDLAGDLAALGRRHGASRFMTLAAGFAAVLSRCSGLVDLPVGSVVAGRTRPECESLIGLFVNTLVLRAELAGDPDFGAMLIRQREVTLEALAHQDVPFEKLVQELQPERSLAHSPLFQVMVMLVDAAWRPFELPGLTLTIESPESGTVKFDLNLALAEEDGRLAGALAYNSDLFDAATAVRLAGHLETLFRAAAADPGLRLSQLPLLSDAEQHQALREWNDTRESLAEGRCLHELFLLQAERTPQAPAIVWEGRLLSYRQLARQAGRLARYLRSLGVRPGVLVAVHLERGPEMVVALLGILQTGGAYVPLSRSFPAERIRHIVSALVIGHLVTEDPRPGGLAVEVAHTVLLPLGGEASSLQSLQSFGSLAFPSQPDDLAYVIFTSGSTGTPKGVMVRHRPAVNLVSWVNRTFGVGPGDRVLFVTALSFDLSVYDVFGILAAGGCLRIAGDEEVRDPARLAGILTAEPITFWDSAPAALQQVAPFLPASPGAGSRLRLVFLSGDWIPIGLPGRVRQAFPQAQVVSLGGATEATVWSNVHLVREVRPHWTSIPYGRPIANARYHVLDPVLGACPIGVPGDLYIGGECLSVGYAGDPALTAGKYLPDPFGGEPGARIYRTGDRARHWADGTMEFLGRSDTQVKVRGFRIELGEIETALAGCPGVREAAVLVREDTPGDQRLVACVIAKDGEPVPALADLRRYLKDRLPDYMLPSDLVLRDAWPVTPTGKLDRRALLAAAPVRAAQGTPRPGVEPRADGVSPRAALERTIAKVWAEVIGRGDVAGTADTADTADIDVQATFFDLGGHSLLIVEVQTRLRAALGREVSIVDLFRYPTVASLAEFLEASAPKRRAVAAFPSVRRRPAAGSAVAVVGLAGRFPGASGVEELWRNLCQGIESISFFTREELAAAGVDPALLDDPGYVRARGVLPEADLFDAEFFGCPPREAEILDPQQRLFLECAWESLEAAGYAAEGCGGRVGVYCGLGDNTYLRGLLSDPKLVRSAGMYQLSLGNKADYLPTRVSYKLDLKGPSVNVQTACSTSLAAIHLASRALLDGECEMALAGGVSVRCPLVSGYRYEEGSIASPDGHVRAFDAAARGTVIGDGAGVVVLKRLDDALADGDTVRAVILGSAINNDGSSRVGFTAPSVEGQAAVIRQAHRAAGVDAETIRYVEAHGTGTAVGDPIEVAGLTLAFRDATEKRGFCALGSLKTNIGHLDAAAGVAGMIKTVLCLEKGSLPASLHYSAPNPRIDFADSPFFVNASLADWPADPGTPRRAGVSSFGIGGTNAHAVLEEAPATEPGGPSRPAQLLLLSARTATALDAATVRLADHLESHPETGLADAAYTLQMGRRAFRHRRMLVCRDREEAVQRLRSLDPVNVLAREHASGPGAVTFLFPGQGAQRAGMGGGLYKAEPAFREALDRACEILVPELGLDLRVLLSSAVAGDAEADRFLEDTAFAQPALFAVEHALARLLMEWGVRPQAMIGHSLGEYVAACLAGVFSLEDGLRLVAARGRLMAALPPGRMLGVDLPEGEALSLLEGFPELSLAAVNAPAACTLSGPEEAVERLRAHLDAEGVQHRLLRTSHAFHSRMMEPILAPFAEEMRRVELRPPEIPFLSNVTGSWITAAEATDPGYWVRHLLCTVRFSDGAAALLASQERVLLEVGPGRALSTLARQQPGGWQRTIVPALGGMKHEGAEPALLLTALGRLWLAGAEVDWSGFYAGERRRRVLLPTYPFERRRFWIDGRPGSVSSAPGAAPPPEPAPTVSATGRTAPRNEIERGVAGVFEELLGVEGVGPGDDFFDLGGSSLMTVQLSSRLRQTLGAGLPASVFLEASTVAALAERIAALQARASSGESPAEDRPSCLIRLAAGGSGRPLFLVHQVGGHVYSFRALARTLGAARPIYGLRSRGFEAGEETLTGVEEMADHYLGLIREVQPRGPYLLGGASMGGVVAAEMACRLRAADEDVPLLALMDTPCRDVLPGPPTDEELLSQVVPPGQSFDADEHGPLLRVLHANVAALFAWSPRAYEGSMLFFRARERRPGDPAHPEHPWIDLAAGGIEIRVVPGNHATMHDPPHVHEMAAHLARRLEALG